MKIKNAVVGEEVQAKKIIACEYGWWYIDRGDYLKVLGFNSGGGVSELLVKVGVREVWLPAKDFRKPKNRGSALSKNILKQGDKYFLCSVSDESDRDALDDVFIVVISNWESGWFIDTEGRDWKFAVPLNSQGKPLYASDVGL